MYREVGVLTEAEVSTLTGFTPAQLKLNPADPRQCLLSRNENGKSQNLFYISLEGLEFATWAGIRKMKIYSRVGVRHDEFALHHSKQIVEGQGTRIYEEQFQGMLSSMLSSWKSGSGAKLPTLRNLLEKVEEIQRDRENRERQEGKLKLAIMNT